MTVTQETAISTRPLADVFGSPAGRIKLAFLLAGFLSLVISVSLWFAGYREEGLFVGLWVPAIHSLGTLVLTPDRR